MRLLLSTVIKGLLSPISGGKGAFFKGGYYARFTRKFGSRYNKCRLEYFARYAARLFQCRSLVLVGALWLSFSPVVLRAEFSQEDRNFLSNRFGELRDDTTQIEFWTESSSGKLTLIRDKLSEFYSNNSQWNAKIVEEMLENQSIFGYTVENTFKADYDAKNATLVEKLEAIITALEDLKASESPEGGSGEGESTINETWLTEDTFKADFGGFVDKYDTFLSSWGFGGGSGDSLKSWLIQRRNRSNVIWQFATDLYSSNVPFPGNNSYWPVVYERQNAWYGSGDPFVDIVESLWDTSGRMANLNLTISKKQAWNDWQAHTNLISRLDSIFSLESKSSLSFDEDTGQLVFDENLGGSSSATVTDVTPVSTNSVDTAVTSVTNSATRVTEIFSKDDVLERYLNENLLVVGQNYGIGDNAGDVSSGVLSTPWFTIDFNQWGASYRQYLPISRLQEWRRWFGYLWNIASVVLCILLVRKWGNM